MNELVIKDLVDPITLIFKNKLNYNCVYFNK